MNGTGHPSEKLLEFLALDRYAERLCSLRVASDALGWTRFCGSLSLVLVVLLFLSGAFLMFYYSPSPGRGLRQRGLCPVLGAFWGCRPGRALLRLEPAPRGPGASPGGDFPHRGLQGSQTARLGLGGADHAGRAAFHHYGRSVALGPEGLLDDPGSQQHHLLGARGRRLDAAPAAGRTPDRNSGAYPVLRAPLHFPAISARRAGRHPFSFSGASGVIRAALGRQGRPGLRAPDTGSGQPLAGFVRSGGGGSRSCVRLLAGPSGQPGGPHGFRLRAQARVVGPAAESVGQHFQGVPSCSSARSLSPGVWPLC